MNDELLFEDLASHDGPAELDGAFEDRLYLILEKELRVGRSVRPQMLLVAAVLAVLALTAAIAVGSGVIEAPWVRPSVVPNPPVQLEWSGPVRREGPTMVVEPMVPQGDVSSGDIWWTWPEEMDAASGWADITLIETSDASRKWSLELALPPPGLAALRTADQILSYGVVLETTGDDVADWVVGIDTDAPEGELRLWITDLATGQSEEQLGGPYGAMPFFDFSHPSEDGSAGDLQRQSMRFFFLGDPGWGSSIRFYASSSLSQAGQVVAWDYAPNTSWLVAQPATGSASQAQVAVSRDDEPLPGRFFTFGGLLL